MKQYSKAINFPNINILIYIIILVFLGVIIAILVDPKVNLTIIFLLFGVLVFFLCYFRYKDIFSPIGLFSLFWFSAIGLSNLKLSTYQSEFTSILWLVLLLGGFSYLMGAGCFDVLSRKSFVVYQNKYGLLKHRFAAMVNRKRLARSIVILFIMCFSAFLYEAYQAGGLPILAEDKLYAYVNFAQHYIHYLTISLVIVCGLISLYFSLFGFILWMLILFILSLLSLVATLARWEVIWALFVFLIPYHYLGEKITLRKTIIYMVPILSLIVMLGSLRTIHAGLDYINRIGGIELPPALYIFSWPYLYFATSIENLQQEIIYVAKYGYDFGIHTFLPLLAFSGLKSIVHIPYYAVSTGFNTGTFLQPFYRDFGIIGVIVFPFMIGFALSYIYLKIRTTKKPILWIMLYSVLIIPIIASISNSLFTQPSIYFFFVILLAVYTYIRRKNRKPSLTKYNSLLRR